MHTAPLPDLVRVCNGTERAYYDCLRQLVASNATGSDARRMKALRELEGQLVFARIPIFHATEFRQLKLVKVEDAGIWVENQALLQVMMSQLQISSMAGPVAFFLPWQQVEVIVNRIDVPPNSRAWSRL